MWNQMPTSRCLKADVHIYLLVQYSGVVTYSSEKGLSSWKSVIMSRWGLIDVIFLDCLCIHYHLNHSKLQHIRLPVLETQFFLKTLAELGENRWETLDMNSSCRKALYYRRIWRTTRVGRGKIIIRNLFFHSMTKIRQTRVRNASRGREELVRATKLGQKWYPLPEHRTKPTGNHLKLILYLAFIGTICNIPHDIVYRW